MDMGWSQNLVDSFRIFQGKVLDEYDRLVDEFGLSVIDASLAITDQQQLVRNLVSRQLENRLRPRWWRRLPGREWSGERRAESREQRKDHMAEEQFENGANGHIQAGRYYGHGLPYLPDRALSGKDHRNRGNGRRGAQHADSAAARMARSAGLWRGGNRLDTVRTDAAHHRAGEIEATR